MQRHLLLGTAGHIDHGKTSLIQALTGTDTDRLPEEKLRGITIDLGFASLELGDLLLGIVDVPGHERFVKNMLAGSMGIDLALLVVAADEGVMPQTREHFEVLNYLGITSGVIALTKCDLADASWMDLVVDDITELVAGSFLANAAIVRVSAHTSEGLQLLRSKLAEAAAHVAPGPIDTPFRLSIDRCFSLPGHGTVVTGSVASGKIEVGEKLQFLPSNVTVQVRGLQSHGRHQTSVKRGQRAALNLTGVHFRDVHRGDLLSTPGSLLPSKLISVQFQSSQYRLQPIDSNVGVRFYSGTAEYVGRMRLLESNSVSKGGSQVAQIELEKPVCTLWGEAFVVRGLSSNEVLGGGRIIDPRARRVSQNQTRSIDWIRRLISVDKSERVAAIAALSGTRFWSPQDLWQRAGVFHGESLLAELVDTGDLCHFECRANPRWLHREVVERLEGRLIEVLYAEHSAEPLLAKIPLGRLQRSFTHLEPSDLLAHLAAGLASVGKLKLDGGSVAAGDWQPSISAKQTVLLNRMIATCAESGLMPPSLAELAAQHALAIDEAESLLQLAAEAGQLIRLPDKERRDAKAAQRARIYIHADGIEMLEHLVGESFDALSEWTISEFGHALGVSRKYAIPLCKHLDQTGITSRQGDLRTLSVSRTS